jgi:hypothetical protein
MKISVWIGSVPTNIWTGHLQNTRHKCSQSNQLSTWVLEKLIVAHLVNSPPLLELKNVLPYSQEPTTVPCPEPHISSLHTHILLSTTSSSGWSLPIRFSIKILCFPQHFNACYITHPSHPLWLDHQININWSLKIMM